MKLKIINLVMFQLGWAVCVLGGNLMAVAFSVIALLIHHRYVVQSKSEWRIIGWVALVGITWDSLLVFFGLIVYPDAIWFSLPIWMVCLWVLFAATFMHSLAWLSRYCWLAVIVGAVFGPMSYWAGIKLSDAFFGASAMMSMAVIATGWAILFPVGIYMTGRFK
ncbi:MAG: hypothetical protein ACI9V8_001637 [Urechidicola sp.]|jgi:hypothetical protein